MQVKKDGRIIIDMQDAAGNMEPGNYTLKVTLKAEGKTFKIKPNGVISFTVVDKKKSEYSYKVEVLVPKLTVVVYKQDSEIYRGRTSFSSTESELVQEAKDALKAQHPDIDSITKK